jgi:glycosyltransferase involved in cell wall biosynthesis
MVTISCAAPFGCGGLGQHLAQLVDDARAARTLDRYFAAKVKAADPAGQEVAPPWWLPWVMRYTPVRFSQTAKGRLGAETFDRGVARRLTPGRVFLGFAGMALSSFARARDLGYQQLWLESPTAHVAHAQRQHELAFAGCPVEGAWLGAKQLAKTLREYELADRIYVNSEYARQTFLAHGIKPEKLRRRVLRIQPRFRRLPGTARDNIFRVVYVGSLAVTKGVPVLLEAFSRFAVRQAELILVGGSGTRGMRRYLGACLRRDPRIRVEPGDPLPVLHRADVYVHPSFQDGFGYAPMEALACGVPVIVTEDTGMKEHVAEGVSGYVVPTGSWEAILDRLEKVRKGSLAAARHLVGGGKP